MSDIKVTNLCKSFGDISVLNNFSVIIKKNETTCIMGPSGCGKTTLVRILANLDVATSGSVSGVPAKKSMVFQEDRLIDTFSAVANIACVASSHSKDSHAIIDNLKAVGLCDDDICRPVSMLSGGMRRRVSIVRAIYAKADVIFLDEPFKGLDEKTKALTMEYVKSHINGVTTILVTHDKSECDFFGGNIIELG